MLLYIVPETDPFFNLALEDYLLRESASAWLLLWRNAPSVLVGRHQTTADVVNLPYVERHGLHVARRTTGGGSVYHDRGIVNLSMITSVKKSAPQNSEPFMHTVARALEALGGRTSLGKHNDVLMNGQRVSVFTHRQHESRLLQHGVLFFDGDPAIAAQALLARPGAEPGGTTTSRCLPAGREGYLRNHLPSGMTVEDFMDDLALEMASNLDEHFWRVERAVDEAGLANVRKLRDGRYATKDWNFGSLPEHDLRHGVQTEGGFLECFVSLHEGVIRHCTLHGDIMALSPLDAVATALEGCRYERADVERVLASLPFEQHFGAFLLADVLRCLFPEVTSQAGQAGYPGSSTAEEGLRVH